LFQKEHVMTSSVAGRELRLIGVFAAAALAATAIVMNHAPARAAAAITEFGVPTFNSMPVGITVGADGNLWFTEWQAGGGHQVGRITPAGTVSEFVGPTVASGPFWIASGPDHNLWFTSTSGNAIGEMSTAGAALGEFPVTTPGSVPDQIAAGPDGNLWFTEFNGNRIANITTAGVVTEFAALTAGAGPTAIIAGPDGNLWFTEQSAGKMGRITTAGVVTEFGGLTAGSTPAGIAVGPDGNIWFTEFDGNRIGRITMAGAVSEFAITTLVSQPGSITAGPDGNLWFTEQNGNKIGQMSPSGAMLGEFDLPTPGSGPGAITAGPDGNLWFTERLTNQIGRLTPAAPVASTALTYTGPASADYNDAATVSATLTDNTVSPAVPLSGQSVVFTLNAADTCSGVTDASGLAACQITPSVQSGSYSLAVTFAGAGQRPGASASATFAVTAEETAITVAASSLVANGSTVSPVATMMEDATRPVAGRSVSLALGTGSAAQQCTATTTAAGSASCAISGAAQALGPDQVSASFGGDGFYKAASSTANTLVFAYLSSGSFVVANDGSVPVGATVTFWGGDTESSHDTESGRHERAFKGFANALSSNPPTCGGTWTSRRGDSSGPPPAPLPAYMAVVVSDSVDQSDSTISGDITSIVIVRTNPGYSPDTESHGTGTVVAVLCSSPTKTGGDQTASLTVRQLTGVRDGKSGRVAASRRRRPRS
jgi:streptogramin lyase